MEQTPPAGLRPNCLLTRYPICFVHGLKSVFNLANYWHGIPKYLKKHGYEIYDFKLPWRGPHESRVESIKSQMKEILKHNDKIHIIAHSLGCLDMITVLRDETLSKKIASVTFVSPPFGGTPIAHLGLIFGDKIFSSTNETLTAFGAEKILKDFKKPENVLIGSFIARPRNNLLNAQVKIQGKLLSDYLKKKNLPYENDGLVPLESQLIAKSLGPVYLELPGDHVQIIGRGPWPSSKRTAHEIYLDHAIFLAEYDFKTAQ
jgi:hypothetical protein